MRVSAATRKRIAELTGVRPMPRKKSARKEESPLEEKWDELWAAAGHEPMTKEHRFSTTRRFKFDRCDIASKVAVELEGGTWGTGKACPTCKQRKAGRHTRGQGFEDDCVKYSLAAISGWAVIRFTTTQIKRHGAECVAMVEAAIRERTGNVTTN